MLFVWALLTVLPAAAAGGVRAIRLRRLGDNDTNDTEPDIEPDTEPEDDSSFMWGSCSETLHNATGCDLDDGLLCSSFLSEGPEDADVELHLTGLPPSTPEADVHIHWWAARQSPFPYFPLRGPQGSAIYRDFRRAYPMYDEESFNGGNMRVDEEGRVKIRVRQPSSYIIDRYILFPHIHIRFCSGLRFASSIADSVFFTFRGPQYVRGFHGQEHENETIDINAVERPDISVRFPTTTSSVEDDSIVTHTDGLVDLRIQDAMEALDLDALEFSPVYTCLAAGRFYDYFTSSCVTACPANSEVRIGQCVRQNRTAELTTLEAAWELELECGELCWHSKLKVTMHHVRLAVADKLNIPFQEVVLASFTRTSRRRLEPPSEHMRSAALLHIVVRSRRVDAAADEPVLQSMFGESAGTSWLLGFVVHSVDATTPPPLDWRGEDLVTLTDSNDPYQGAYDNAARRSEPGVPVPGMPGTVVPIWAAVTAAGVVLLLIVLYCSVVTYRRRRARASGAHPMEVLGVPVVQGRAPAEDYGPTKPTTMGASKASTADDDGYPTKPQQPDAAAASGSRV
mmetsp:Transcript_87539/g.252428  ORF Transcript_87539/g.252428 Transcript_87539/m.252428 type:complete len:568 (+) Transcript_87539:109-1812(+)